MTVLVRSPRPLERSLVLQLVLLSDCGTLPALFGPRVRDLLEYLQGLPANPYSAVHTLVAAVEADGPAVAAAVGSLVRDIRGSGMKTALQLARWYGPSVLGLLPRLARAGRSLQQLARSDFYLSHIAVLPERQGAGIGARLLRAMEDRARRLGSARLVLDVDEHNGGARAFYDRRGYREDSAIRIDLGRLGIFGLLRLSRQV